MVGVVSRRVWMGLAGQLGLVLFPERAVKVPELVHVVRGVGGVVVGGDEVFGQVAYACVHGGEDAVHENMNLCCVEAFVCID